MSDQTPEQKIERLTEVNKAMVAVLACNTKLLLGIARELEKAGLPEAAALCTYAVEMDVRVLAASEGVKVTPEQTAELVAIIQREMITPKPPKPDAHAEAASLLGLMASKAPVGSC